MDVCQFRINSLLLIVITGLCSCASERTVTNKFQTNQQSSSGESDHELMNSLEARFAGGFSLQTDKDGNTKMVSDKRSSFEGVNYNGNLSQIEKKAFTTSVFGKKKFEGASSKFETKSWDGVKSFTDGKLETPDFITQAKGIKTRAWQDASKQYATQRSDLQGRAWAEANKRLEHSFNQDIENKRNSFGKPTIMSTNQAQAKTIQETREMMGRTD